MPTRAWLDKDQPEDHCDSLRSEESEVGPWELV